MHISDTGLSDPAAYALRPSGPMDRPSPATVLGYGLLCAAVALAASFFAL